MTGLSEELMRLFDVTQNLDHPTCSDWIYIFLMKHWNSLPWVKIDLFPWQTVVPCCVVCPGFYNALSVNYYNLANNLFSCTKMMLFSVLYFKHNKSDFLIFPIRFNFTQIIFCWLNLNRTVKMFQSASHFYE